MPQRMFAMIGYLLLCSGCSAIYPIHGVPAAYLPHEYHGATREGKATIDLALLQRSKPDRYRIEAGDVLAIYAPGLLGLVDTQPDQPRGDSPPINLPQNNTDRPSLGFPVTVRDDHTIQIPQLPPLDVYGLTEGEVEEKLKRSVQQAGLLASDTQPRIVVSILRHRTYRILVCRQESSTSPPSTMAAGTIDIGRAGKGTSRVVDLRAYENDVAHALAQPGVDGLPGLDARNEIYVIRARNNRGRGNTSSRFMPGSIPPSGMSIGQRRSDSAVRGQSPTASLRWPGNARSSQPAPPTRVDQPAQPVQNGPYRYFEASEFNLSGRDIAHGSYGPDLIDPIPGMTPQSTLTSTPSPAHSGYGHSAPDRPEFRNPTLSTRSYSATNGQQYSPIATHSQAPPRTNALTYRGARQETPPTESRYQPVQYVAPTPSPTPISPIESQYPTAPNSIMPQQAIPQQSMPQQLMPDSSPAVPHTGQTYSPVMPRYPGGGTPGQGLHAPLPSMPSPVIDQPANVQPVPQFVPQQEYQPEPQLVEPRDYTASWQSTLNAFDPTIENAEIIKIPVRLNPGESLDITEEDITLYDGDIVFIESRETDVYFIGGLLGGGQYQLPRDRDLHVIEAISLAQGQNSNRSGSQGMQSSGGVSALNRDITPSASRLIILRKVGCNQVATIEVDLYKALRYPHENITVQPEDMLILQYTPCEATLAFFQRNLLEGALLGIAAGSFQSGGK